MIINKVEAMQIFILQDAFAEKYTREFVHSGEIIIVFYKKDAKRNERVKGKFIAIQNGEIGDEELVLDTSIEYQARTTAISLDKIVGIEKVEK